MRSVEKPSSNHPARWYFLTLGWAMGSQIFQALSRDEEFATVDAGEAVPEAKVLVRYYQTYDPWGTAQPPYQPEQAKELGREFHGCSFPLDAKNPPEKIDGLNEAYQQLTGVAPSGSRGQPLIVILADSRFDTLMRGFQYWLNMRYVQSGGLPIVKMLYTDELESARNLLLLYQLREKSPHHEERFKTWCATRRLEPAAFEQRT